MTHRPYASPEDFRRALDQRLRAGSKSPEETMRRRRRLAFDRLLARLTPDFGDDVLLKGGLVIELRIERAHATRDVDFGFRGTPTRFLDRLRAAASRDLQDFLEFEIVPNRDQPAIRGDPIPFEGQRYSVASFLADTPFIHPFGLDVGYSDPIVGEIEVLPARDTTHFVGVSPPRIPICPVETPLGGEAPCLHAPATWVEFTHEGSPRHRAARVVSGLSRSVFRDAIATTFEFRASHPVPRRFEDPPSPWTAPYRALAESDGLPWPSLPVLTEAVRAFLDPVLSATTRATWNRPTWRWIVSE